MDQRDTPDCPGEAEDVLGFCSHKSIQLLNAFVRGRSMCWVHHVFGYSPFLNHSRENQLDLFHSRLSGTKKTYNSSFFVEKAVIRWFGQKGVLMHIILIVIIFTWFVSFCASPWCQRFLLGAVYKRAGFY